MSARTIVLFVALSCSTAYAAETRNIDKTLPLNANGVVTLETHNGTVRVHTWDKAQIEIHAEIEAAGSSSEDRRRFQETTVEIDGSGAAVRIKSKLPDNCCSSWLFWGGNNPQIHYTITAPRTARWTVRDHNSKTDMRDIRASVDIETHNGSVRVSELGGPLNLSMHNGSANVEFASFTGSSSVDTHNGSVELTLPRNSRFDLHASTHHGGLHSDFPISTQTFGRRDDGVEGSVNGGGPALRLSAHNGELRIHAR